MYFAVRPGKWWITKYLEHHEPSRWVVTGERSSKTVFSRQAKSPTWPPVCQKSTVWPSTNFCWRTYAMRPAIAFPV